MNKILLIILIFPFVIFGQTDSILTNGKIKSCIKVDTTNNTDSFASIFNFCNNTKKVMLKAESGNKYDSLGEKHGCWIEEIEVIVAFYNETSTCAYTGTESGYYIHGHKEGIWEVKSNNKLISHRLYEKDILLYEVFYQKRRIKSIIKIKAVKQPNSRNGLVRWYKPEIFYFGKKGKLRYVRYQAPDGVINEHNIN